MSCHRVLLWVCCAAVALSAQTTLTPRSVDKKLIEYGWDVPFPDYVRDHIREMEALPFDGLVFKLRGGGRVMTPKAFDEAQYAADFEACPQIQWERFTDNFVIFWAASDQDWFDDSHWQAIETNTRLMTRAARLARCVGICFDHEPYGTNPWAYNRAQHRDERSFAEYEAKVRQRGAQFIRAVEAELPGATILTFFQLSYFAAFMAPMDPAERAAGLSSHSYALLPAFLHGILDAASPGVTVIDGNEGAYYYTDSASYLSMVHQVTQRARYLIDPAVWDRYHNQVQVGQALYVDQYFGLRARKVLGHYMPLEDQQRWFTHNVYWALHTADRYVWCYSERMNWWTGKDVPAGAVDAIRAARERLAAGKPLGFDLAPAVERAQQRQRDEVAGRLKRRSAEIARRPAEVAAPAVDGRLDDAAWSKAAALEPLGPLASGPDKLSAETRAQVLYDEEALYVAVRCGEPKADAVRSQGTRHDDAGIWQGDVLELMVGVDGKTLPFVHFMVNPKGVAWDARHTPETDLSFSPPWERAVGTAEGAWTVEMVIPWSSMGMAAPKPGTALRVNLCRQRSAAHELSAWSPMAEGFLEHDLFGTWTFR